MAVILLVRNCLYLSSSLFKAVHQQNLENATNRLAANFSMLGGRKFGKCNKQAGGKLVKARQQ